MEEGTMGCSLTVQWWNRGRAQRDSAMETLKWDGARGNRKLELWREREVTAMGQPYMSYSRLQLSETVKKTME